MNTASKDKDINSRKVIFNYPLLKESDMTEEMKTDTMDLCVTSYEKHSTDHEKVARLIKETLDQKYGASWHVVVGEAFGFQISHDAKHLMYMFLAGNKAICVWKCS
ncbi:dynein light chain 4, axonemal [Nephila pilipes]|uniref:Dynein light chain n=1 Tax=Nephila pilipes TaxID=299642 RepID=A0A8X6T8N9_NEPPI|nr:dynein light chain 4, axonemal [Nephila pilipes]GFS88033.1 dynein light chain 4, axonemal [Nephila pilipes]GFT29410.1 dynein light chain 4, axonemal [Nephila pilipes]GFU07794.1 dynein light chain 4, axonemal [Nephila pilipes]